MPSYPIQNRLNCLRCDGKGKFMNEFGLMEKCPSCKRPEMTFDKINDRDLDDQFVKIRLWFEIVLEWKK